MEIWFKFFAFASVIMGLVIIFYLQWRIQKSHAWHRLGLLLFGFSFVFLSADLWQRAKGIHTPDLFYLVVAGGMVTAAYMVVFGFSWMLYKQAKGRA